MIPTKANNTAQPNRRIMLTGAVFASAAAVAERAAASQRESSVKASKKKVGSRRGNQVLAKDAVISNGVPVDLSHLQRVTQEMVAPPFAPKHDLFALDDPKIVEVHFDIEEKLMVVDEDTDAKIWALTFNGFVPGPLIIVHEGDYVELTLSNPESSVFEHNIDFHAATGGLGGGALTHVLPGEKAVLRWKAIKPGVFVYHCAPGGDMTPYHVCHGMNGAVMVLPRNGLRSATGEAITYDEIIYIGEQDYYLPVDDEGEFTQYESAGDDYFESLDAMAGLIPTHSVFNGAVGALTGDNALISEVDKAVMIIHAQANRDSRPHLVGGHADYVWEGGSFSDPPMTGFETWFIRGGSAGAAIYTFKQPGPYMYVNHNLIEAVQMGALAHVLVEGKWDNDLMTQVTSPTSIKT